MEKEIEFTLSTWRYRRTGTGDWRPVTQKLFREWFSGDAALPPDEGGYVWMAAVGVWMAKRKPVLVRDIAYSRYRVDKNGVHTKELLDKYMSASMRVVWSGMDRAMAAAAAAKSAEAPPAIDARASFAYQQYRWKPTKEEVAALRSLVATRAGRDIFPKDEKKPRTK